MEKDIKFITYFKRYMYFIGYAGHFLYIFQTVKIFNGHSAKDISLPGFLISAISVASWLIYGVIIKDKVLTRVNLFGITCALICLYAILSV